MTSKLSRRNFVNSVVAAGVAGALSQAEMFASAPPKNVDRLDGVQLAIATICVDGFGMHRHEPAFRVIPELGFTNVEFNLWYPDLITPRYIESIQSRCYQTGLTPVSIQASSFGGQGNAGVAKDLAHKLVLLDACKELGATILKCTGARRGMNGDLESIIEVLKHLAPAAEDKGIIVVLENHANNVLERVEDYEEIFSAIDSPNVGMCLDTGHFEGVSIDLGEVIETFHDRILHVNLKDCRERGKGHDTVPFGTGVTDFEAFLSHLMRKDYQGYLVVEQAWPEPRGDWVNDLKAAYKMFKKWEA